MFETQTATTASDETVPIESATASTACQTNDSPIAYALVCGVLGAAALVACLALAFALFAGSAASDGSMAQYGSPDGYSYEFDDDGMDGYGDSLGDGFTES